MRGKNENLIALVAQLKGQKVLVKGNHDDVSDARYKQLFHEICDYKEIMDSFEGRSYKLILSHYPILMWNGQHRGSILLYGHTHNSKEDEFFQKCIDEMNSNTYIIHENDKKFKSINVGCMKGYMGYEPRSLKELLGC